MAEQSAPKDTTPKTKAESTAPAADEPTAPPAGDAGSAAETAPAQAGRVQPGEKTSGLTTRPPRGVGEPAADTLADDPGVRAAQESVHKSVKEDSARGFRGTQVDPTPNEAYTVKGVTEGQPTPESAVVTPRGV